MDPVIAPTSSANAGAVALTTDDQADTDRTVISSDFETFLRLLTTQLENQDPLSPMQSEEFAVQLATFSGVEQQVKTNDLLDSLGAQLGAMGMAQFAGWVGMEALATGPARFAGEPVTITPDPSATADTVVIAVKDANGQTVQRLSAPVSNQPMQWDGHDDAGVPFAHGDYTFEVESYRNGELQSIEQAAVYSRVSEVRQEDGETMLLTSTGLGIAATEVTALREPPGA